MEDIHQRPQPMAKPDERDGVICPNSSDQSTPHPPEKVYDTIENGKRVRRGIIASHKHGFIKKEECPWTGLPVPITPRKITNKE